MRGAATLKARLQKGYSTAAIALTGEQVEEGRESNVAETLNFVSKGGELLKRTRKGIFSFKRIKKERRSACNCSMLLYFKS